MPPLYELLKLPCDSSDQTELRALARSHSGASLAPHSSRSYCGPLALVAWHTEPLGVDLERLQPTGATFAESICTPAELDRFATRLGDDAFVSSLWASKEALAKALGDAVAYDPRRLESPLGWHDGAEGRWRSLALQPAPGHVAWLVWGVGAQSSCASTAGSSPSAQRSCASAASAASTRRLAGRR